MGTLENSEDPMKCCIMQHFIMVYIVYQHKIDLQRKKYIFFFNYNSSISYNGQFSRYCMYSNTCVKRPLKNIENNDLLDKW